MTRKQKSAAYWSSVTVVVVLFIATLVINYLAGLSADESYFGAHWWHRLAWVMRLPSFSGHPICTDLVSVREDVHCESTAQEVHA